MTEGFQMTGLASTTRTTLAAQAAAQVRERIESKEWPVGTKLPSELELAEALGVARNTVREALRSLTHLGVLEARAGDGTYVRIGTELAAVLHRGMATTNPEEVLELRGLLEQHAVGQAAQRRTESELQEIQKLMLEVRKVSRSGNHAAHAAADGVFHLAVVRIGGNDFLTQMYEQVTAAFGEFLSGCDIDADTQTEQDVWHENLVTAIEDGDADAARQAAATIVDINRRSLQEQRN